MRKVIFCVNTSLDGFTAGPKGELDWLIPHAVTEESWRHFRDIRRTVDTVLLGRLNYEGFLSYWPSVATNPASAKKDVELSRWLDDAEKVVFSRTLKKVDWKNARLAKGGVEEVVELKKRPGKDLLIMTSTRLGQSLVDLDLAIGGRAHGEPSRRTLRAMWRDLLCVQRVRSRADVLRDAVSQSQPRGDRPSRKGGASSESTRAARSPRSES